MSFETGILQSRVKFVARDVGAAGALYPRLSLSFDISHTGQAGYTLGLEILKIDVSVRSKKGAVLHVGTAIPDQPILLLPPGGSSFMMTYLALDQFILHGLETVREGGDLNLFLQIGATGEQQNQPQTRQVLSPGQIQFEFRVPKSDWVERILPGLGYKEVALIEIPKLAGLGFDEVVQYINSGWKDYTMGEYDKVLTECRKSLEVLKEKTKEKGFIESDGKIDWKKLFDNEDTGDIIGSVYQKTLGFVAPGSHAGRSKNRETAEFALMITQAVANITMRRLLDN